MDASPRFLLCYDRSRSLRYPDGSRSSVTTLIGPFSLRARPRLRLLRFCDGIPRRRGPCGAAWLSTDVPKCCYFRSVMDLLLIFQISQVLNQDVTFGTTSCTALLVGGPGRAGPGGRVSWFPGESLENTTRTNYGKASRGLASFSRFGNF